MDAPHKLETVVDGAGVGAWNMAVDHALMARAREGRPCLRLYRWDPPCLSFGRNQRARGRYSREAARRRGADVVRRPTGGRAVYHHRELTYAFAAPDGAWGGLRESYRRINRALARALRELGVAAEIQGTRERRSPGPSSRACFRDPLPGEVVVDGRKLVGSAQWRNRGALLQHGSILLGDDQRMAEELRIGDGDDGGGGVGGRDRNGGRDGEGGRDDAGGEGGSDGGGAGPVRAASVADCLEELPGEERMAAALRDGFAREFGLEPAGLAGAGALRERARERVSRYRDEEWTWRR